MAWLSDFWEDEILPVDTEPEIVHIINVLLPCVELPPLVYVLPAGGAPHVARRHQPDLKCRIPLLLGLGDFGPVVIRGIVFVEDFSLRHCCICFLKANLNSKLY